MNNNVVLPIMTDRNIILISSEASARHSVFESGSKDACEADYDVWKGPYPRSVYIAVARACMSTMIPSISYHDTIGMHVRSRLRRVKGAPSNINVNCRGPAFHGNDSIIPFLSMSKRQTTTTRRVKGAPRSQGPLPAWQRVHHTISYVIKQYDLTACLFSIEERACNTLVMNRVFFLEKTSHWKL